MGQPGNQLVHFWNGLRDGSLVLLAPTGDLALKIVTRPAVTGQSLGRKIDQMQGRNDAVHLGINSFALGRLHARQGLIPKNAPGNEFHDVEGAANHRLVFAKNQHLGYRYGGSRQAAHNGVFALNGVCRRQQFGHRSGFGPHHVAARWGDELVGWVALPAFEGFHRQRAGVTGQVVFQPGRQCGHVKRVLACNCLGAYKMVKVAHGLLKRMGEWH